MAAATAALVSSLATAQELPPRRVDPPQPPLPSLVDPSDLEPILRDRGRAVPEGLGALRRLVQQFAFEDPETFPTDLPRGFYRMLTADSGRPGFPPFGDLRLARDHSASGRWSLRMTLDGGSIAAAIPSGTVPVFPHADYVVLAKVRTEGLQHAAARVEVRLLDGDGKPIPYSQIASPLVRTDGRWETVAVTVPGAFDEAADLVFELQLLQPRQFGSGPQVAEEPLLEDLRGRAWFDDVEVWRVPRVELATSRPGGVFVLPDQPVLEVSLHDLASEPVVGELVVRDVDGHVVQRDQLRPEPGRGAMRVPFRPQRTGWYEATLTVGDSGRIIVDRSIRLVLLPPSERDWRVAPAMRFGVDALRLPNERVDLFVELVAALGMDAASFGLWDPVEDPLSRGSRWPRLRTAVHHLLDRRVQPTIVLDDVPFTLARSMGIDPEALLDLLAPSRGLAPSLQEILIDLGQHVQRWQLGRDGRRSALFAGDLGGRVARAERTLSALLPGPRVLVPWPASYQPDPGLPPANALVTVPSQVVPPALEEYIRVWRGDDDSPGAPRPDLRLERLDDRDYGHRAAVEDLALRTLHAWRHGARTATIEAPWTWSEESDVGASPQPAFAAWHQLADRLGGRRFGGEVRLGDGIRCWILEGDERSALVAWNESAAPGTTVSVALGADAVTVVDIFGNRASVRPIDGLHTFAVPSTPIFIEDVDMPLARFRAGFAVLPSFAPSLHREHVHEMVLRNPWPVTITGSVRMLEPSDWEFNPRVVSFTAPAGGEVRLPLVFTFGRNELAGMKRLVVEASFTANREYVVQLEAPIEVGFAGVELSITWGLARNLTKGTVDLVLTHSITNRGEEYLNLEAFVVANGFQQLRRPIPDLAPGQTAQRIFQLEDGAAKLAGQSIRVGVMQSDGPIRLTKELEIPAMAGSAGP